MYRRLNGTSDEWRAGLGSNNLLGNFTIAVLHKPQAADEGALVSFWDATTERVSFGMTSAKKPQLKIGATNLTGNGEILTTPATGESVLHVVSKEEGTKAPRWHQRCFTAGIQEHVSDTSTLGNPVTQAGGGLRFGNGTTHGFAQYDLMAAAVWTKVLTDEEINALAASASILGGWKASASGLWMLKQKEVSEEVPDATGNGANQTARTGTTVIESEPQIPYEAVPSPLAMVI
jgi:hypothetical protein